MSLSKDEKIAAAVREWIDIKNWNNPYAVTFTLKKKINRYESKNSDKVYLDEFKASQNFRYFLNILNKQVFGNGAQRYGLKVDVFPIIEQSDTKHLHYHIILDCPSGIKTNNYEELIRECWAKTDWGDVQMCVKSFADSGWVSYITKIADKYSIADAIDWNNVYKNSL